MPRTVTPRTPAIHPQTTLPIPHYLRHFAPYTPAPLRQNTALRHFAAGRFSLWRWNYLFKARDNIAFQLVLQLDDAVQI